MSTDYYLFSPSGKKAVMVGSVGLGGVRSWPAEYGGRKFIAWAIENNIADVCLINEHELHGIEERDDVQMDNITRYDKSEDVFELRYAAEGWQPIATIPTDRRIEVKAPPHSESQGSMAVIWECMPNGHCLWCWADKRRGGLMVPIVPIAWREVDR